VRGLDVEDAHRIIEAVARHGAFRRMSDLREASGASVVALRRLAAADAFLSMGLDRQQASWQILALRDHERPLWSFAQAVRDEAARETPPPQQDPHEPNLPAVGEISDIAKDFEATGVTLKRHPIACIRERLQRARVVPCGFLRNDERTPAGRILSLVGLVLVRQRPSTAKGIVFMTIEDETGVANLIFRPKVYERLRSQVRHAVAICVRGKVERRDGVTHLLVANARDVTASLAGQQGAVSSSARDFR
jgi:error-prone DNA polymerase